MKQLRTKRQTRDFKSKIREERTEQIPDRPTAEHTDQLVPKDGRRAAKSSLQQATTEQSALR